MCEMARFQELTDQLRVAYGQLHGVEYAHAALVGALKSIVASVSDERNLADINQALSRAVKNSTMEILKQTQEQPQ